MIYAPRSLLPVPGFLILLHFSLPCWTLNFLFSPGSLPHEIQYLPESLPSDLWSVPPIHPPFFFFFFTPANRPSYAFLRFLSNSHASLHLNFSTSTSCTRPFSISSSLPCLFSFPSSVRHLHQPSHPHDPAFLLPQLYRCSLCLPTARLLCSLAMMHLCFPPQLQFPGYLYR